MKFFSMIAVMSLALSSAAFGCSEDGSTGIVEENSIRIPVGMKFAEGGLSEAQFKKVIDDLEAIYVPVAKKMGGTLKINRLWTDATANANATRMGSTWTVNMYGGLARHPAITADGFSLVLCHEIGHQMGGAPKTNAMLGMMKWASNEGQSDYWATLKCLRTLFWNDNNQKIVKTLSAPESLTTACAKAHPNKDEAAICVRTGMAGMSVSKFFQASRKETVDPKFETPVSTPVARTNHSHPATQCRLDTYFQGSLCEKAHTEEVSQKDEVQATCHGFTGQTVGLRPTCWFKASK